MTRGLRNPRISFVKNQGTEPTRAGYHVAQNKKLAMARLPCPRCVYPYLAVSIAHTRSQSSRDHARSPSQNASSLSYPQLQLPAAPGLDRRALPLKIGIFSRRCPCSVESTSHKYKPKKQIASGAFETKQEIRREIHIV